MAGIADLEGNVAVVTGGASGIGLGIARRLAAAGARVVIGDVEVGALHAAADEVGALAVQTDVRHRDSVQALADAAVERFGTVNIVVNNAGVGPFGRLADLTEADWRWIVDVNLWGVIHGVSVFLPIVQGAPGGGHIVNTASMAGLRPGPNLGAYTVTKYGVVALTETLAIELAQDGSQVGVTVLCPGPVHTNIGTSTRNRPPGLEGSLADAELQMTEGRTWMDPDEVGDITVEAIRDGELYAVTHPAMFPPVQERFERITAAFEKRERSGGPASPSRPGA
jgi:NAD(P)-dependent dehydrogenase (short-subunit alcohol dehydrogenase family)